MPHTDHLKTFIQQIETDTTFQEHFKKNPADALEPFHLTSHERDAILTRDFDDLVALDAVGSIDELPDFLRRRDDDEPHYNAPEELHDRIERPKDRVPNAPAPEVPLQPEPEPTPDT